MARAQGAGLALAAAVLLGLSLSGAAAAQSLNLTALLPGAGDLAPLGLAPRFVQPVGFNSLVGVKCDAVPAEGVRENLEPVPSPGALPTGAGSAARVSLYRFDAPDNASRFVECYHALLAGTTQYSQRPVPYGEVGYVAELGPGASAGASILFARGAVVASIDALNNSFPSASAHALAQALDGRLPRAEPRKSPGFEAVFAAAGLGAAALAGARKRRH